MGSIDDEPYEEVDELLLEAERLPHGPSRMAVAEEAVRLADAHGNRELSYDARMAVLEAAVFGGYPEKALVAFGWLAATCDAEPELFPESRALGGFLLLEIDLLWTYKWVVQNTPGFPQISRHQIEDSLDEMQKRYTRNGFSLRPVWMNRAWVGMELGDAAEQVAEYFTAWDRASRDAYADCEACEQNFRVEVLRFLDEWDEAVAAAQPLVNGELKCAEVPHLTISNLMMGYWERGDLDMAKQLHQRGYEMCRGNRDFLAELAEHVDYRIVTGDLAGAASLAERHLNWVDESRSGRRRWRWFVTLGELFAEISKARDHVAVRVPQRLQPPDDAEDPARLAAWFRNEADRLNIAFDERNGNDSVSRRAQELVSRIHATHG